MEGEIGGPGAGGPGAGFPPGTGTPDGAQPGTPDRPSEPGLNNSTFQYSLMGKAILLTLNLVLDANAHDNLMSNHVRPALIRRKGLMDMAGGQLRVHELAAALKAYTEVNKRFPRGTFDRPVPSQRNGRGYAPNERVSWMAELLAFLDQAELQQRIDPKKSWKDKDNLAAAMTLIPPFVDPQSPSTAWWARFPGAATEVATTQFVGVAGVGLDAAEYKPGDPKDDKKIGVFGYDRATQLSDIKDRPSETIALIQVPTKFKRPWLAGGGSTVIGVPETDSVKPFVCDHPNGKRGALAIMADGQVRFIPENISPENFKAMCTIRGDDEVRLGEAPVVPPPEPPAESRPDTLPAAPTPMPPAPAAAPAAPPPAPPAEKPPAPEPPKQASRPAGGDDQAVLLVASNFCAKCHTGARSKGKVQIFLSPGVLNPHAPKKEMGDAVAAGKMPPPKAPQPGGSDLAKLKSWLGV
jgi:hypothetical protein